MMLSLVTSVTANILKATDSIRKKATDILVVMLSDLDRVKTSASPVMSIPVWYGFAGKSLPVQNIRELVRAVIKKLKQKNITVSATGYDGQMSQMTVKDDDGRSLTLLQEQKLLFSEEKKRAKNVLARELAGCPSSGMNGEL